MNDWKVDELAVDVFWDTINIQDNIKQFAVDIYDGVRKSKDDIDHLIERHSTNWRIDRMSKVDRNILRLATYEIVYRRDIPANVTMNEAIENGKKYGLPLAYNEAVDKQSWNELKKFLSDIFSG